MVKWKAQELLDSLNNETNYEEMKELWKAIISYELGATIVDNEMFEELFKWYGENDTITSFISLDILDKAQEIFEKNN